MKLPKIKKMLITKNCFVIASYYPKFIDFQIRLYNYGSLITFNLAFYKFHLHCSYLRGNK
jgi:hypothetical protein